MYVRYPAGTKHLSPDVRLNFNDEYEYLSVNEWICKLVFLWRSSKIKLNPLFKDKFTFELLKKHDNWYKGNCEFVWVYCKYFWESHVEMNEINIIREYMGIPLEKTKQNIK